MDRLPISPSCARMRDEGLPCTVKIDGDLSVLTVRNPSARPREPSGAARKVRSVQPRSVMVDKDVKAGKVGTLSCCHDCASPSSRYARYFDEVCVETTTEDVCDGNDRLPMHGKPMRTALRENSEKAGKAKTAANQGKSPS